MELVAAFGCRSQRQVSVVETRNQSDEIDVVAHRLDSLWSHLVERYHVHVEFFNPNELQDNNSESLTTESNGFTGLWTTNHTTQQGTAPRVGQSSNLPPSSGIGGLGAVKSLDIVAERTQSEQSLSQTDSTAVSKTESDEARQTEKASEARQDNGTWAILAIVAAVTFIVALIIVLKKFTKK